MKGSAGRRVLMLLENSTYPHDLRVRREALHLVASGYQVIVICPTRPGLEKNGVIDGVHIYRYRAPAEGNGIFGYLWEYGYSMVAMFILSLVVLFREGFDIIHAHNPPDSLVLIAAFYKPFGKKFMFDHHDLAPEMYYARFDGSSNPTLYRLQVWLEQLSCRLADQIIATNGSYKAVEMQRGRVPEERIMIVRNGPDLDVFQPAPPDLSLRKDGKMIIGFAGVMGFQDGVDYLIRALYHLVNDLGRTDFFCYLIGGLGDARPNLKMLITQLNFESQIQFTGWVSDSDYIRYLCATDICVDPDPSNPFNDRSTMNKMMEYMALGKPVVAFDLPEHRMTAGSAALYAYPNDEYDMAEKIACLMDDPHLRRKIGAEGRKRVEEILAWSHQKKHLLEAYESIRSN